VIRPEQELLLAPDVQMVPVSALDEKMRGAFKGADAERVALTRRMGRAASTLVDAALAEVLEEFREPSTIAQAILRYSQRTGLDGAATLDDVYVSLRQCFEHGYLVDAHDDRATATEVIFAPGDEVADGTVVRCVHLVDDVEVHQVVLASGRLLAVKVARTPATAPLLDNEAQVLAHLAGRVAPALVARSRPDEVSWLALEWCHGSKAPDVASGLRTGGGRQALISLAARLAAAYVTLHDLGVVHGDVHPGNVLVTPSGEIRLIDFGLALWAGATGSPPPRGGVLPFYDPAHAAAVLAGRVPPSVSESADIYGLAAVLHELLTGHHHLDLSLERDVALRQIANEEPVLAPTLPVEVSAVLGAALGGEPGARPRASDLAAALGTLVPAPALGHDLRKDPLEQLVDGVLAALGPGGTWFDHGLPNGGPRSSVFYGSAGIAAATRRVAMLRSDHAMSALADEWSERALADSEEPDAFASVELGVTSEEIGQVSPYLQRSGLHATEALVAHARADVAGARRAVGRYVATATGPSESLDVTLGVGGVLLTTAMLLETLGVAHPAAAPLQELGQGTSARLWRALNDEADISEATELTYLGVAHGWAGVLLASLRWHAAAGTPPPLGLPDRLEQLASLSRTVGLGAWWPATNRRDRLGWSSHAGGWCHGTAGYVHLWSTAFAAYGERRWAELAERAGWDTYTTRTRISQLCCGACGQAYALLALYRLTEASAWRDRAAELARDAASLSAYHRGAEVRLPASLFKGDVGIATLGVDLEHPDEASMPFFGPDQ